MHADLRIVTVLRSWAGARQATLGFAYMIAVHKVDECIQEEEAVQHVEFMEPVVANNACEVRKRKALVVLGATPGLGLGARSFRRDGVVVTVRTERRN
eukprot:3599692-Pyramimonas_sp.AAC.1